MKRSGQLVYISKTQSGVYGFFTHGFLVMAINTKRVPLTKDDAIRMVMTRLGDNFRLDDNWSRIRSSGE